MLEKQCKEEGLEKLYDKAMKIDPEAMEKISKNDKKRIIRVLEIYHKTGKTKTMQELNSREETKYDYKVFILNLNREKLYQRINKRIDMMIKEGLIEEVQNLLSKYKDFPTAMQGIGYKEVVEYLQYNVRDDAHIDPEKEKMIEKLKMETRRYAKRQITWFRKIENAIWLD